MTADAGVEPQERYLQLFFHLESTREQGLNTLYYSSIGLGCKQLPKNEEKGDNTT